VAGWLAVQRYDFAVNTPLAHGVVDHWPTDSTIQRHEGRPTLVLFIHPRCPCTRATLAELERMLSTTNGPEIVADTVVVSTVPAGSDDAWLETDVVARAKLLPGVRFVVDPDGHEAARFGATTSGTAIVFDAEGNRQYAGGATASRGHEGDNLGRAMIADALRGQTVAHRDLPAFGCRLCLPADSESLTLANQSTP
jgi:hypothetical protein